MRTAIAVVAVLVAVACGASPIEQEIARLEQTLNSIDAANLPEATRGLIQSHRDALARAKKANSPDYKLYRLRDPFTGIETLAFLAKHKDAAASVETVEKLWNEHRARFEAKPPKARGTLLERGLIESAATRAERLYHASLPYAKASAPWSGIYYLGEADANLRFRDFVHSIASQSKEGSPSRAQVASMLGNLERDTLTFFAADVTNQAAVPVSVRLKETRELLDANRVDGAALLLLEARAALSRRGGPKGNYQAAPRAGSLASMVEAWAGDEQAPMSDALRGEVAAFQSALFGRVIPSAVEGPSPSRRSQVTVTLVRWPYT